MANSAAITALVDEHIVILEVVESLQRFCAALRNRQQLHPAVLRQALAFMRNFADGCHHVKEEDLLFPALVAAGLPERVGPVALLNSEHDQARECIGRFADAVDDYEQGEAGARDRLVAALACIGALYPQHIAKENEVLYPMAEQVLGPTALSELAEQFEEVERVQGEDAHERWSAAAARLTAASLAAAAAPGTR